MLKWMDIACYNLLQTLINVCAIKASQEMKVTLNIVKLIF